ncbi:MAG: hypothetical protein MJE68_29415, partial [Proteobacteria bacterium]|nr:hypothetical protein [Pseudomonadota bacterium]
MVQNFREIAENPMIENFRDKNFVIATFFRDSHRARAATSVTLSLRPQLHVAQRWPIGLVQCMHANVKR